MSTNDESDIGAPNGDSSSGALNEQPPVARGSTQAISIDEIMWRVRSELARRQGNRDHGTESPAEFSEVRSFDLSIPNWEPAVPRLPAKDTYHVSELLAYSDADFVDMAYRCVFRRAPDDAGFNHYLQALRGGRVTKIALLQTLLASPEGQAVGVHVDGMYLPSLLERWRTIRFIGPIIAWAHALLRLDASVTRQAARDAYHSREIQELGRIVNEGTQQFAQRIAALKVEVAGRAKVTELAELKKDHASVLTHLHHLEAEILARSQALDDRINHLDTSHESRDEQAAVALRALDSFYAAFEDHFRGDRAVIRTRVEPYLPLIREAGAGTPEAPVVDVGCGRGEWLELIRDSGLIGKGIEINRVFIDMCRGLGLDITEGDAIESLRAMPEGSAGAVTAMHLIEHLAFEQAIALLDEMRRVLRPGGIVIVETPNPENLSVGHHWFYTDPTHRNPIPPQTLRWIVEARGFSEIRIERLDLARGLNVPPPVNTDVPGADAINTLMASMRVGSDYAVIGKRS
jgi:O-antigen chain-terminating methyltransferase